MSKTRILILGWLLMIAPLLAGEPEGAPPQPEKKPPVVKVVHLIVALCDNDNQGIVKVPPSLGNGQDPAKNLYWGAQFGVKTWFEKSPAWTALEGTEGPIATPSAEVLERIVFFHKQTSTYLVADAYDGAKIKQAIDRFLFPMHGDKVEGVVSRPIHLGTNVNLRAFVGHNGLMDFSIAPTKPNGHPPAPAIILACKSKEYFDPLLSGANMWPLLTTTNLMAPEAYTLDAAICSWAAGKPPQTVREEAAEAYAKYQRIEVKSALGLFAAGTPPASIGPADGEVINETNGQKPEGVKATTAAPKMVGQIPPPAGFVRWRIPNLDADTADWYGMLSALPLKAPDTPVRSHDGTMIKTAADVVGVIDWPTPHKVQQCADVAIRLRAQYMRKSGKVVSFNSLSGDELSYEKWLTGRYGISADGNRIVYTPESSRPDTKSEFENYLIYVMTYANSASLARDLEKIEPGQPVYWGDLYIQPPTKGHYGHVSVVLDIARQEDAPDKAVYLMGWGFIPAQDFEIVKPAPGEGVGDWFTLAGFQKHVASFGEGAFYRFKP